MLLSLFAIAIGVLVGRIRGGTWSGVLSARLHRPGFLVFGIFTMLVLNIIGPAFPLLWAVVGTVAIIWFGLRNLQLTGMIIMLIGLLMNLTPLMANGSMPASELALVSVGQVDDSGHAEIDGLRESTETATAFSAFGDVIPVPIFNMVVSIGDLVMLVALADIVANLLLRRRKPSEVTEPEPALSAELPEVPTILSPLSRSVKSRPAHAAHRRPRRGAAPSTHVPAHAKNPDDVFGLPPATEADVLAMSEGDTDDMVIVLDGPDAYIDHAAPTTAAEVSKDKDDVDLDITNAPQPWADEGDLTDLDQALLELESLSSVLAPAVAIPPTVIEVPEDDHTAEFDMAAHMGADSVEQEGDSADEDPYDSGEDTTRLQRIEAVEQPKQQSMIDLTAPEGQPEPAMLTGAVDKETTQSQPRQQAMSTGSVDKETTQSQPRQQAMSTGSVDKETVDKQTVDRRPIIDLTVSPTDEQLQEFLRRRAEADAEFERRRNAPGPRPRGRAPRRNAKVADLTS